jgi:hypothetical protein
MGLLLAADGWAEIVVSEYFSGRIQAFDPTTKVQRTLATVAGNPGLSGLAYHAPTNVLYASALNHGGVYRLDATTGATLGFSMLGIGPGGLAVAANGQVYVTDFGSNLVRIYEATLSNQLGNFATPNGPTSGVGFLANGDALVATAGSGVYRYDGTQVTLFSANPVASGQVASDALGNTYIGHGLGFSDSALRFDASGNLLGSINITPAMVNSTGNGSSSGTSPSGVAFDLQGNLFVAALGQSNPGDPGGERGGLFKYTADGQLLEVFAAGSNAYSSVVSITAIPEPGSLGLIAMVSLTAAAWRKRTSLSRKRLEG